MLISNNLTSTIPHWVRNAIRLCALGLLPLGLVRCVPDGARLMNLEEEFSPLETLSIQEVTTTVMLENTEAMVAFVKAAVESRSMTQEEADRFIGTLKRVRVAIESGRLTREQAEDRLLAMLETLSGSRAVTRSRDASRSERPIDFDALERRIRTAIANGSISRENAAFWRGVLARGRAMEAKINAAVASGRVTAEQGAARFQAGLRALLARARSSRTTSALQAWAIHDPAT